MARVPDGPSPAGYCGHPSRLRLDMSTRHPLGSEHPTGAPSTTLALAAAAGDDTSARDRFIAAASASGDPVSVIAEYLGLSRQQVHAILDKQRQVPGPDPRGVPPTPEQLTVWRATEAALESMTSSEGFERLVQVLLGDIDPSIRPLGGVGDRGRDAVSDLAGGDGSIYSISLEREWSRKIRREVTRILEFRVFDRDSSTGSLTVAPPEPPSRSLKSGPEHAA